MVTYDVNTTTNYNAEIEAAAPRPALPAVAAFLGRLLHRGVRRKTAALMRFGYWMPIFGGWLRNVTDEGMSIAWPYIRDLAVASEQHGLRADP